MWNAGHGSTRARSAAFCSWLDTNVEVAMEKDGDWTLPLHQALKKNTPTEVLLLHCPPPHTHTRTSSHHQHQCVSALLTAFPDGARSTTANQWTPLRCALSHPCSSAATVRVVVQAFPEALDLSDEHGRTPLHIAMVRASFL
jgi:hypothetical protein